MKPLSLDTLPETERILLEGYRRMPGWRKLKIVQDLNRTVAQLALNDLRRRYPQASERELQLRLAARRYGAEFLVRGFWMGP